MKMYIHVFELVDVDDCGAMEFVPIAMFASVLDADMFYYASKKKHPENRYIIIDTIKHCQVDPITEPI